MYARFTASWIHCAQVRVVPRAAFVELRDA